MNTEPEARTPAAILERAMRSAGPLLSPQDEWQPFPPDEGPELHDLSELVAIPLSLVLAVVCVAALIGG
jgi:hypothetical protein